MSQPSSSKICKYDVFLSFRGEDTRRNIVSHLYNALQQKGIHTFKDDERLETGKPISDELLKAIEEAKFAVIIFSKSYASSRWCLEELAHIIKCKNELGQILIPVFYDVSPSDVRHQNPPFADSFSQHEEKYKDDIEKVQRWRGAFVEAGKLSGYHLLNFKDEAECIKKIIDDIFPKSLQIISPFPERLVGMKSQVEKVTSLLDMKSNDVRSIGIWGMGGIGKTEIANVVHQRYHHRFEADCFLGDVGKLHQKNGLTWLQEVVIFKLVGERMTLTSEYEGMNILRNMLRWKKVLLILDDVNHQEQLESLVGGPKCFGIGSRIILTARDKHLLINHVGENVYEVRLLSDEKALELFSRHAFKEKSPKKDFVELSIQVVKHAGGLPLALKVLGSLFYGRDKRHWSHMIDRLKRIPHKDIQGKLRLSFDGLDEDEKELFLDITFMNIVGFGNGSFSLYVELVLRDAYLIDYLIEKSLLSMNIHNRIVMHNMIRGMGEKVIREEYTSSRIWLPEEVCDLFKGKLITEKVESLCIPEEYFFEDDQLVNYSNIFKRIQNLKVLIVGGYGTFSSICAITYLPSSLRFIKWEGYPSTSLPESFEPSQLVVLSLRKSCLVELWPISKKLSNLKHLDLSFSRELTKTPNFGDMPNLERLNLWGCVNLEEVHPSLGHCRMLTSLSLRGCVKLKKLPENIGDLRGLKSLYLKGCEDVISLPNCLCNLMNLRYLFLSGCKKLEKLPENIGDVRGLKSLYLKGCEDLVSLPDSLCKMNLQDFSIEGCKKLDKLPENIGDLRGLKSLYLKDCEDLVSLPDSLCKMNLQDFSVEGCKQLEKLPENIGDLRGLKSLNLKGCEDLVSLPDNLCNLINLQYFSVEGCKQLKKLPENIGHLRGLKSLNLKGCEDLVSLPESLCKMNLQDFSVEGCKQLEKLPENIGDLRGLKSLNLKSCEDLVSLPDCLCNLMNLQYLFLSGCKQLEKLPETMGDLKGLKSLNLKGCEDLVSLPDNLHNLMNLQDFSVEGCKQLEKLPKNIGDLRGLKSLYLKGCEDLVSLPDSLCKMNLQDFSVEGCKQLEKLPENIGDLRGLKSLNLKGCEDLFSLPDSLCNLMNLQVFSVEGCKQLEKLPENIGDLRGLKSLNLKGCEDLVSLPDSLCKMNLQDFSVEGCKQLEKLPENIGDLRGLKSLNLKGCEELVSLPDCLCNLMNLQDFSVEGCKKLDKLPENIGDLRGLKSLNLKGCEDLVSLPGSLYKMNLQELSVEGCKKLEKLPEKHL